MEHRIRAFIAKEEVIGSITRSWHLATEHELPQGYALTFLNDALLDDIEELVDTANTGKYPALPFLTDSVMEFLAEKSAGTRILYIEADDFSAYSLQTGIIFEDGRADDVPVSDEGAVNSLLRSMGVYCAGGRTETDTMQLYRFTKMD